MSCATLHSIYTALRPTCIYGLAALATGPRSGEGKTASATSSLSHEPLGVGGRGVGGARNENADSAHLPRNQWRLLKTQRIRARQSAACA